MTSEADRETVEAAPSRRHTPVGAPSDQPPRVPERIGHFHLKRLIASGGMGAVYEAVQDQPRRTVAVKVMRQGLTSRSALRRFEYEAQILARLRHPGIAQIHEAGTHDDGTGGVPYFVMEYIPGARPITEYALAKRLDSRERLDLFLQVCDAVHHGHQKGIIHRDLKPGNILVDSSGQVKIIDFGVARATDSDLAVTTLQTDVGQLVGTVQYMSPEQIEADPHDIDTRSDVYSLGVLLYELLVEKLPYDVATVAVYEAARIIREQPPTRLSTVNRSLRGDLETIAQKALEKNRERRYQSTTELAQDIRRYLNAEPISARPPSLVYQLRSFARRHRYAFAAAAGIVIALVLGMIGTSWGMIQANEQRRAAVDARDRAQHEAERAMTINTFLQNMLTSIDPAIAQGEEVTVRNLLDDLTGRLDDAFPNSPETEAELRATIGTTYRNLGRFADAEPQLRRAFELRRLTLGESHPDTLRSMTDIGVIVNDLGHLAEAERVFREALRRQREVLGDTDPLVLATTNALAWTVYNQARPVEAEPLFRRTLELQRAIEGSNAPRAIKTVTNLAVTLIEQEKLDEAEPLIEEAVALSLNRLGERHPDTLYARSIQAWLFREQGRYDESVALYRDIISLATAVFGAEHKFTLFWRQAIAWALFDGDDPVEAERLTRPVLADRMRILGPEHPETIDSMDALGRFIMAQGRFAEAVEELRRALAVCERALPDSDYRRGSIRDALVHALVGLERFGEAESVAMDYYRIVSRQFGDDDAALQPVHQLLAELYDAWGRPDEAAEWRAKLDGEPVP